ncbi:MAG: tetratricopeptide repeat protein, partial [Bacteroidota bacterium]
VIFLWATHRHRFIVPALALHLLFIAGQTFSQPFTEKGGAYLEAETYVQQGNFHMDEGEWEAAVEFYLSAVDADPSHQAAQFNLALANFHLGNFGKAELSLEKLAEAGSADAQTLELLGLARYHRGNFEKSISAFSAAMQVRQTESLYLNRGLALASASHPKEAFNDFNQALKMNPDNLAACLGKGAVLIELGQFSLALDWLDKALELEPGNASALTNQAIAHFKMEEKDAAAGLFEQAISLQPQASIFLARGQCRLEVRDWSGALQDVKLAMEVEPENPEVYFFLGTVEMKMGNAAAAIESFSIALEVNPTVACLMKRAEAFRQNNQHYEAINDAYRALDLEPGNQESKQFLMVAYEKLDEANLSQK